MSYITSSGLRMHPTLGSTVHVLFLLFYLEHNSWSMTTCPDFGHFSEQVWRTFTASRKSFFQFPYPQQQHRYRADDRHSHMIPSVSLKRGLRWNQWRTWRAHPWRVERGGKSWWTPLVCILKALPSNVLICTQHTGGEELLCDWITWLCWLHKVSTKTAHLEDTLSPAGGLLETSWHSWRS